MQLLTLFAQFQITVKGWYNIGDTIRMACRKKNSLLCSVTYRGEEVDLNLRWEQFDGTGAGAPDYSSPPRSVPVPKQGRRGSLDSNMPSVRTQVKAQLHARLNNEIKMDKLQHDDVNAFLESRASRTEKAKKKKKGRRSSVDSNMPGAYSLSNRTVPTMGCVGEDLVVDNKTGQKTASDGTDDLKMKKTKKKKKRRGSLDSNMPGMEGHGQADGTVEVGVCQSNSVGMMGDRMGDMGIDELSAASADTEKKALRRKKKTRRGSLDSNMPDVPPMPTMGDTDEIAAFLNSYVPPEPLEPPSTMKSPQAVYHVPEPAVQHVITNKTAEFDGVFDVRTLYVGSLGGHSGCVWSVASMGKGRLASASEDRSIRVWSANGELECNLTGHTGPIYSVICVQDRLVTASEDWTVRIWTPSDARCKQVLNGHKGPVTCVASMDMGYGRIISGSVAKNVRIWNKYGRHEEVLSGHSSSVLSVTSLKDGRVASGGADKLVCIWDSEGKCSRKLKGNPGKVISLSLLEGGRLACVSEPRTVRIYDLESMRCKRELEGESKTRVQCVTCLGNGRIATAVDDNICLWGADGKVERYLKGHSDTVYSLANLGDGRLASGSKDEFVRVWEIPDLS